MRETQHPQNTKISHVPKESHRHNKTTYTKPPQRSPSVIDTPPTGGTPGWRSGEGRHLQEKWEASASPDGALRAQTTPRGDQSVPHTWGVPPLMSTKDSLHSKSPALASIDNPSHDKYATMTAYIPRMESQGYGLPHGVPTHGRTLAVRPPVFPSVGTFFFVRVRLARGWFLFAHPSLSLHPSLRSCSPCRVCAWVEALAFVGGGCWWMGCVVVLWVPCLLVGGVLCAGCGFRFEWVPSRHGVFFVWGGFG